MTTTQVPPRAKTVDVLATIILAVVGVTFGIFLGGLYLLFTPLASLWVPWSIACIALMVVPVVTAVIGLVRLTRGRLAFWVPLLGLVLGIALFAVLLVVGDAGTYVVPADFG